MSNRTRFIKDPIRSKIISKLYGMALMRFLDSEKPVITIPEFKFIIGSWKIKKKHWFKFLKELERDGIVDHWSFRAGLYINISVIKVERG